MMPRSHSVVAPMPDFSIGVTYWPRRKGPLLWAELDRGEVRDEFQQLAAIGLNTLRLPLHWEEFQPRPERVSTTALRALEHMLDLASDTALRVVPELLPVAVAGAIHIPAWTTAASFAADMTLATKFGPLVIVRNEHRPPLVWERSIHTTEVRDLWTNPTMRDAQRKLLAEVVGYFGDHPAITGWELGSGLELARAPSSSDAAGEWLGETADVARQHGARGPLFYAATLRAPRRREGPRPEALSDAGITPVINMVPPEAPFNGEPLTVDMLRFVAALVYALGRTVPILIVGVPAVANAGNTTVQDQAYGRQVEQPLLDHDAHARLIETVLPELNTTGVPGVWFAHGFCYGNPFPPERAHTQSERMMGLFDTDGSELPVANAVQRFARQSVTVPAAVFASLDVEDYWSDPATHLRRLWQQWQAQHDAT